MKLCLAFCGLLTLWACAYQGATSEAVTKRPKPYQASAKMPVQQNPAKVIHVLVALCDNEYQGIVPVPPRIGNGDDPKNNLYWGAAFGVKTFFSRSQEWQLVAETIGPQPEILQRLVFKHKTKEAYLIADAYRGREIKRSIEDFFAFASGSKGDLVEIQNSKLTIGGGANVIAFVGHDGLMDFSLDEYPTKQDGLKREAIILACLSKKYFARPLKQTGAEPLLWTTNLMAPEAYVLKAALDGWLLNENRDKIRLRAAQAYNAYQHCGLKSALNLFSSEW